jgi:hypothetical protein
MIIRVIAVDEQQIAKALEINQSTVSRVLASLSQNRGAAKTANRRQRCANCQRGHLDVVVEAENVAPARRLFKCARKRRQPD